MGSQALTQSPLVRTLYTPFQKVLHYVRRRAHPDVPLDHAVMNGQYGDRRFAIEVRRWSFPDHEVVKQCFVERQYDMPQKAHGAYLDGLFRQIVEAGRKPLIVDCGANIGASVLWFSARYPGSHIVAVEPAADNFSLLQKNTRGLDVDLRQAGIGRESGEAWLSNPGDTWAYRTNDQREGAAVQIISLESILQSKPPEVYVPFLLKIDIEGAEKELFRGQDEVLDRFPLIVMEPHDWMLPGERSSLEFFRFHARTEREFAMRGENIASISYPG